MVIVRDISERKALLEKDRALAEERDNARVELIRMLAHEVRNPMAALKGLAQLLPIKSPETAVGDLSELMVREVDRLTRMINEVLDVMISLAKSGMTMVVVTHEMGFARRAANRVVFMADGQIVEENAPEAFFTQPQSERAKDFLGKILTH
jgi:glutamate transport system ATP-binding protein